MNEVLLGGKYECPRCVKEMHLIKHKDWSDTYELACCESDENAHYLRRSIRNSTFFEESNFTLIDISIFTFM